MAAVLKVLTFGWEFPPHISGGLGTACHGLTSALLELGMDILFVVPKAHGDEDMSLIDAGKYISSGRASQPGYSLSHSVSPGMKTIPVHSRVVPYTTSVDISPPTRLEQWNYTIDKTVPARSAMPSNADEKKIGFSGTYGPRLLDEVALYADVGAMIARENSFDLIHAHDWLTFPAGIAARKVSGKPLIVHVHATEWDRAGSLTDAKIVEIEARGFKEADRIVAVSQWTKEILISKYQVDSRKIVVIHNGVASGTGVRHERSPVGKRIVTFMGRITYQKGPSYFVSAARKVLRKFPDTHFVVAGAGDLLPSMIELVARFGISSQFHFTGFLRGEQVRKLWSVSDVYVMPSVSEPFGIAPLEAVAAGVPIIVSNQSGVAEVMPHAIKTDFWDAQALADAICGVLQHKSLSRTLKRNSRQTLKKITWQAAATKLTTLYHELAKK